MRARPILVLLAGLLLAITVDAQRSRKRGRELKLGIGKTFECKDLDVEFKVPQKAKVRFQGKGNAGLRATLGFDKFNYRIEVGVAPGLKLEDVRERIISDVEKQYPRATTRIHRGENYGGMKALTMVLSGLGGGERGTTVMYNVIDVPYHGPVYLKVAGPAKEEAKVKELSDWLMPSFRMSGRDGDDLIFEPSIVDRKTGLGYRIPKGTTAKAPSAEGVIFEGQAQGGAFIQLERLSEASGGNLDKVLTDWAGGAPAKLKPVGIPTRAGQGETGIAVYDKYGGRPERAFVAFRPNPKNMFRIVVAGSKAPQLHAERMATVLKWIDIPALEAEVAGWIPEVEKALKQDNERTLRKYASDAAKRYYLKASLEVARLILKSGPERAQIDALDAIERGGDPEVDFMTIRKAITNSRFKDRTKMRIRAAEALGAFVNLKSTNLLVKLARGDKDTLVAKAAAITLGRHRANRKKLIPFCVRQWERAVKEVEKKDSKKALRGSRLGDAHRHALRGLTGEDFKNPKEARDWWRKNQKIVSQEELVK